MSRCASLCVFGWAVLVSILAGAAIGTALLAFFTSLPLDEMAGLLYVGAVVSMPMTLPMGLIGGIMAARFSRRRGQTWSRNEWLCQGACWGAALGAFGPMLYFGGMGLAQRLSHPTGEEPWRLMLLLMLLGIPTGIAAGLITAALVIASLARAKRQATL